MGAATQRAGLLLAVALAAGCVERRFTVTSDPPGAVCFVNGQPVGATPVDVQFVYYGNYDVTLVKEGYETKTVRQKVRAPFYEYYPLDFVSEHVYPGHIQDVRRFHYQLDRAMVPRTDQLLEEAGRLKERAKVLPGDPPEPPKADQPAPPPRLLAPEAATPPAATP
jgi:hypothetical protein